MPVSKVKKDSKLNFEALRAQEMRPNIIPTPSIALNNMLGGGIYDDAWVHIQGNEGTNKSTLAASIAVEAMKLGRPVLSLVGETGSNLNRFFTKEQRETMLFTNPVHGSLNAEDLEELCEIYFTNPAVEKFGGLVILDSYNSLGSIKRESAADTLVAAKARYATQFVAVFNKMRLRGVGKPSTPFIVVVQGRANFNKVGFGAPDVVFRTNYAWEYEATIDLTMKYIGAEKYQDEKVADNIRIVLDKDKQTPMAKHSFGTSFSGGRFDRAGELLRLGEVLGVIEHTKNTYAFVVPNSDGSTYSFKENGYWPARMAIHSDSKIQEYLHAQILERIESEDASKTIYEQSKEEPIGEPATTFGATPEAVDW
jgi:hypothetical protein